MVPPKWKCSGVSQFELLGYSGNLDVRPKGQHGSTIRKRLKLKCFESNDLHQVEERKDNFLLSTSWKRACIFSSLSDPFPLDSVPPPMVLPRAVLLETPVHAPHWPRLSNIYIFTGQPDRLFNLPHHQYKRNALETPYWHCFAPWHGAKEWRAAGDFPTTSWLVQNAEFHQRLLHREGVGFTMWS